MFSSSADEVFKISFIRSLEPSPRRKRPGIGWPSVTTYGSATLARMSSSSAGGRAPHSLARMSSSSAGGRAPHSQECFLPPLMKFLKYPSSEALSQVPGGSGLGVNADDQPTGALHSQECPLPPLEGERYIP